MTNSFSRKQAALAVFCALGLGVVSGAASAQADTDTRGYLTDQRSGVAKSNYGLCWHTSEWTPAQAVAECDPDLMRKPVATRSLPIQVAAAAPPPVAAATPAAQKITLDADTLFDFDKAVLRPAGKAALDDFVAMASDISPEVIMAVGHADRFGSEAYNQSLSERRVDAVKAYLVAHGIDTNRIKTEGRGETQPQTKSGDCLGAKSEKVIACLQPDRRVDIELIGTAIVK